MSSRLWSNCTFPPAPNSGSAIKKHSNYTGVTGDQHPNRSLKHWPTADLGLPALILGKSPEESYVTGNFCEILSSCGRKTCSKTSKSLQRQPPPLIEETRASVAHQTSVFSQAQNAKEKGMKTRPDQSPLRMMAKFQLGQSSSWKETLLIWSYGRILPLPIGLHCSYSTKKSQKAAPPRSPHKHQGGFLPWSWL